MTCECFIDRTGQFCGEPQIGSITAACIHEHIHTRPICAACAAKIQRDDNELECSWCLQAAEAHSCRLLVTIAWEDGTPPLVVQSVAP